MEQKAAEPLLKIAIEPDDWAISGDRFGEYPEIPIVKKAADSARDSEGQMLNDLAVEVSYQSGCPR